MRDARTPISPEEGLRQHPRRASYRASRVPPRPLLSYQDLGKADTDELIRLALAILARPEDHEGTLDGRRVGLLFSAPSTRTRVAFWCAAIDLGADVISFGPGDLQISTGETWSDTGRMLSEYLDAVVVRTNGPLEEMRAMARYLPATINALSRSEHPTQAVADYCAIHEHFGKVEGIRLAYFGEANNTATALVLLLTRVEGVRFDLYCPQGYGLAPAVAAAVVTVAERSGAELRMFDAVAEPADPIDVLYTTRWQAMGVARTSSDWRAEFEPFRVTQQLFDRFGEPGRTVFMHDLPAMRGEEVVDEVLDGEHSIVQRQAHHKRTAAATALLYCLAGGGASNRDPS